MSGTSAYEHVNVVRSGIDDQRRTVHFADDAAKIDRRKKPGLMRGRRPCAEKIKWNKILPDVWDIFFRPSGASVIFLGASTHGLRRGLHSFAASRLRCGAHC